MVTRIVLAAVVVVACQGKGDDGGTAIPTASGSAVPSDAPPAPPPGDVAPLVADDAGKTDDPDAPPDPNKVIAELGAIPAWQAVVDRAQLLGRRNQHGVVYGRIGPAILMPGVASDAVDGGVPVDAGMVPSPYVWLVDDTEGNGTLGIRVALGGKPAAAGDRVALGGAWQLDDQRRWYWKVDSLQPVPPAPPSDLKEPPAPEPTHAIAMGNLIPGSRMLTFARDGDSVYFQIVGPPPATEGDGWLVADELGDPPFAFLTLPGERPSYGAQDMRAPDERWQLKRAQTYNVRIGKVRKRDGKPALIHARTAPIRVN